MKSYVVFSDIHGTDTEPIREMLDGRKVDAGICLGDFDRTHTALEVRDLQRDYEMHVVPGNHDHAHINKIDIYSGIMSKQGISSQMMWKEWEDNKEARTYVEELLDKTTIELEIGGNKTLAIHGGLGGEFQTEPSNLWNRIRSNQDYVDNFRKMEESDIKIMLRGHDHSPQFARMDPKSGFKKYDASGHGYNMFNERMHIVNPGTFFQGNYAIITEGEHPVIEYKNLDL